MKNILNAKWLFVVNTLPLVLLLGLLYKDYEVLLTILGQEDLSLWQNFLLGLAAIGLSVLFYGTWLSLSKRQVSIFFAPTGLLTTLFYCVSFLHYEQRLYSWSAPRWMLTDNIELYLGTFLMPTVAYCLLVLVVWAQHSEGFAKSIPKLLLSAAVPFCIFSLFFIINTLAINAEMTIDGYFMSFLFAIGYAALMLVPAYFIHRLALKHSVSTLQKSNSMWKIGLIAVLAPCLGLTLNYYLDNAFGNFTSIWFWILAIANGLVLCLPNVENLLGRIFIFALRGVFFPFILYFFLLFLPYTPLGLLCILALGLGVLIFVPSAVFIIQVQLLYSDLIFLVRNFNKSAYLIFFLSVLILPLIITASFWNDRAILHEALDCAFNPNYQKQYNINTHNLERTLEVIRARKGRENAMLFMNKHDVPFINMYYQWLVLDKMSLSDEKIARLESIFLNQGRYNVSNDDFRKDSLVNIKNYEVESEYHAEAKCWRTWLHLNIQCDDTLNLGNQSEYSTRFNLPAGCFINDYYLMVGDRKEKGILSEKKAALWIYNQIVSTRRDPGILYYEGFNQIRFQVFPFSNNEIRKTGIQFLHKEPFVLNIDQSKIFLGDTIKNSPESNFILESKNYIYISKNKKIELDKVILKPRYHFLIDNSNQETLTLNKSIKVLEKFISNKNLNLSEHKISSVDLNCKTVSLDKYKELFLSAQPVPYGFYLEKAIKALQIDHYLKPQTTYPVYVVISPNFASAIMPNNFQDLAFTFLENSHLYYLNHTQPSVFSYPLLQTTLPDTLNDLALPPDVEVLAWPSKNKPQAYFKNNGEAETWFKIQENTPFDDKVLENDLESALELQAQQIQFLCFPHVAEANWLSLVRKSFQTKVLSDLTAYLALETEAQKIMLRRKQEEVLSGKKQLDIADSEQRMSEPEEWLLLVILLSVIVLWWWKTKQ
ncbi:MAG: MSEP-CTERM sorting domain-containing protein [Cytophagales bacterium]|nr:MAG: MSEP-CTERM sorting domain-containing protein [Cytophagales bacterium]TAF60834.1 MAG: MSEP-CTERM sorting domain-containing protein [Cytophagales bacterium]